MRLPALHEPNPVLRVRAIFGWLGTADGRKHRRIAVSTEGGRAHIKVRGAQRPEPAPLVRNVKSAPGRIDGVDWAEVERAWSAVGSLG
jgi:hypothetical protein